MIRLVDKVLRYCNCIHHKHNYLLPLTICHRLGMEEDLAGAGYNVNQSKIAIGSGGLTGKGFLNGTQTKLKYEMCIRDSV